VIVFAVCLAGCSSSKSKWTLQDYDQAKGYTFVKDGVTLIRLDVRHISRLVGLAVVERSPGVCG
jgi:hypothetical protein